jgi:hypothetical protein
MNINNIKLKSNSALAFGVLLLEIGLWEPILSIVKRQDQLKLSKLETSPDLVKTFLLKTCNDELSYACGKRFQNMVEKCLTSDFGVDPKSDTMLHTALQLEFRGEVVAGLKEEWSIMAVEHSS